MNKLLELREERNGREVTYEVESVEEVDKFLGTDEWIHELHDNIIQAYIDTMGRKEEGFEPLSRTNEMFIIRISAAGDNDLETDILSRNGLDEILPSFSLKQMNDFRKLNAKFLKDVGKLSEKFLRDTAAIGKKSK